MQDASGGETAQGGPSVQQGVISVRERAPNLTVVVGVTLTLDDQIALQVLLDTARENVVDARTDMYREHMERAVALLEGVFRSIDSGTRVDELRAEIARKLRAELLDETPTNIDPNPAAMIRDAGYRAGWNDRARSLAKELES